MKGNSKKTSFFILYDQLRWEEKSLIEAAKKKDIKLEVINCRENSIDLDKDEFTYCDDIILQRCVSYYNNLHSTAAFEGLGAKMINSLYTAIMCGNKLFTHMELAKSGIAIPKAFCAFSNQSAMDILNKNGYPKVIKPVVGSWGRMVALLRDKEAAEAVIEDREHMYPLYHVFYFEEFVKRPPRDIRCIIVGNKVVAAIYRYSGDNEWKTNMALGGKAEACKVTNEMEGLCLKVAKTLKGEILGVDLMESDENGLLVHEVNNTTEFKNTVRVTEIDIPSLIIDHMVKTNK
ncbi:MAG TPA: lysine biosynthesis protein LysX [Nitrososphaeraceae archaeon]|nr:lysine biosynthesis protein LysX [Nitrososphaeraceae archaeon]